MPNNRIFYACQAVAIAPTGAPVTAAHVVHGAQSVGVNTNFNLEQVFELGQLEIYENIENVPDVELTIEKVIDGWPLLWELATERAGGTNDLTFRAKQQSDIYLGIFDETKDSVSADGIPDAEVQLPAMYISNVSYNFPVDGNATESMTFVGNNKLWVGQTAPGAKLVGGVVGALNGGDEPFDSPAGLGVQRREDVLIGSCRFPTAIKGVANNGNGGAMGVNGPLIHVQSISISTDFNREDILELGRKMPYYRPAGFPIEVTCDIEVISTEGDGVEALEAGKAAFVGGPFEGNNTAQEWIYIYLKNGYYFDVGNKNRLSSITYGGGDAGGGNATVTYSFSNFNYLKVGHV